MARRNRRTANGTAPFDKPCQNLTRHDKVLIVCEDTKSSRFYIIDLVKHLHLQSARVLVIAGANSAPISVVNTAIKMAYPKNEDAFDRIFIVIDRDTHPTYDNALGKLKQFDHAASEKFMSIVSFPSFEVWILYHFIYTRSPMPCADDVIKKIKACGFDYDKANNNLFGETVEKLDIAL
ncbi:MAG: RloB family protein, partial [Psychrosphaera sp.]|nr:RloB family protein [Psychrosphaera sp.]